MASSKLKDPPDHHGYAPLPPVPLEQRQQQTPYFVVVPIYIQAFRRRRRWCCCLTSAVTILLLAVAVFFLWPSEPHLKLVRLRLDRLHFQINPKISLDITLGVTAKVQNPDIYGIDYQSLNVSIGYRGKQLGFVTSDHGHVRARGSSYVDATLVLDAVEVLFDSILLIEDLALGSLQLDAVTEIRGKLKLFFIQLPVKAKLSCEIHVNTRNQTIERQNCFPE